MITEWKEGSAGEGQVLTDVTIMPVQCYPRRVRGGAVPPGSNRPLTTAFCDAMNKK